MFEDLTVEKLLTIIDSISDGVLAIDPEMRVTFFNQAAERITGYTKEDAIGRQCWEVFHTDVCDSDCPLKKTFRTGKPVINRYVCSTDSAGKKTPISVSTALLKNERGNVIGGIETFRDLTQVETFRTETDGRYSYAGIVGRSKPMTELFELLPTIAQSDSTVLIEGESGTGKELLARAIHHLSPRRKKPMVVVNCGAIPDTLLESELFGYKAGAFTDARKDKLGRFAMAEGGSLFLDEIGDVSPAMQIKLLRVLQDHIYEPLGSTQSEKADVRIITATNRDLKTLMEADQFRQDLFYRINVVGIKAPPLRERRSDIPLLIDFFIDKFNQLRNKDITGVTASTMSILMNHPYTGNVRELENIIEHAFVICPSGVIRPEHLPGHIRETRPVPVVEIAGTLDEMEALFLTAALKRNNWNRRDTARELNINPSTLYRKIKKLGLSFPRSKNTSSESSE